MKTKTYRIDRETIQRWNLGRDVGAEMTDLVSAMLPLYDRFGESIVAAESSDGGTLFVYRSQEDADADATGADAIASVIVETEA